MYIHLNIKTILLVYDYLKWEKTITKYIIESFRKLF